MNSAMHELIAICSVGTLKFLSLHSVNYLRKTHSRCRISYIFCSPQQQYFFPSSSDCQISITFEFQIRLNCSSMFLMRNIGIATPVGTQPNNQLLLSTKNSYKVIIINSTNVKRDKLYLIFYNFFFFRNGLRKILIICTVVLPL